MGVEGVRGGGEVIIYKEGLPGVRDVNVKGEERVRGEVISKEGLDGAGVRQSVMESVGSQNRQEGLMITQEDEIRNIGGVKDVEEDKVKVKAISNGVRSQQKSEEGSGSPEKSFVMKSKVPKLKLLGGGGQESNQGGLANREEGWDEGGTDRDVLRDVRWHRDNKSGKKRQHSGTSISKLYNYTDYETNTVRKMVERWEVLEKESGTSLTPPDRFNFKLIEAKLQEESPLKRRKLQQRDDQDIDHQTPSSKLRSGQRDTPRRRRPVSRAPPGARPSSPPCKLPEQHPVPVPMAVYSVNKPGNLSSGPRWPPTRMRPDSTPSKPWAGRQRSGSISTPCEEHPPQTVMPGQAGRLHHLHSQEHRSGHHLPFDDLVPSTEKSISSSTSPPSSLGRKKLSKLKENEVSEAKLKFKIIFDRKKEKEGKIQVLNKEDEEKVVRKIIETPGISGRPQLMKNIIHTNLQEPRSEASSTQCCTLISVGFCGPGASPSSSGRSGTTLTTPGGRGRVQGASRGYSCGDNIGTLLQRGENCRAGATYACTQFCGSNATREGTEDEGTGLAGQWERDNSTNQNGALGLAKEQQRADATPKGDCNKLRSTPQRRNQTR